MSLQTVTRPGLFCAIAIFLFVGLASAADSNAERAVARAMGETPLVNDLRELCDTIGGRPTGSQACERAVEWGVRKFKEAGLDNVHTESFPIPDLWLAESEQAEVISPAHFPVRIAAAPFTKGVNVEATVLDAGDGSEAAFQKLGSKARGAIVLIHNKEMRTFDDLFAEYMNSSGFVERAKKAGAAVLLLQSSRPRGLLYRHPTVFEGISDLPAAVVSREHGERIARLAQLGTVRVRVNLKNRTGGRYESKNVIADIRGSDKPDEIVLIGAHLDSWDLGTGSEDNGANCAMVIDVARGLRQLGIRPRRTIRFVLFTGEEQGMWGSAGYVQSHKREMDKHIVAVVFDTGSGRTSGFYLNGRAELNGPVNAALAPVAGLGATEHTNDVLDGTDNFDFMLSGVPNLVAIQDPIPYLPDYHAESDVFERSNLREEKATAAIASALVLGLADAPGRPAKRQTREEVEQLIVDAKLEFQMKAFAQWNGWKAGKRGVF